MRHGPPDSLSHLVAATLKRGFPLLRFPAPLEARYQDVMSARRLRVMIMGFVFCSPLYLLLLVADHQMVPDSMALALKLRLGVFFPAVGLGGLALLRMKSPVAREWSWAGLGFLSCLISVLISVSSRSGLNVYHLATLNGIVIYTMLLGRFWPMLAMGSGVSTIYFASVWHMGGLFSDIGVGNALLLQANISYMLYGSYLLERSSRQSFLVDLQEGEMDAELQQTTDQLARIAQEDALTGLANRRRFTEGLHQACEHAQRAGEAMALLMIDVDHFKAYNDRYGHPMGDDCLRRVAQSLATSVRPSHDLVARWGGEEFAVILPDADAALASDMAARMLGSVKACDIAHEASPVASVVTLSIGVAVWRPGEGDVVTKLIAVADEALYQSKSTGRDRATLRDLTLADGRAPNEGCPFEHHAVSVL